MKKILFLIVNALLVLVVGILVGVCTDVLTTSSSLGGFICLLVSLCIPSVIYIFGGILKLPGVVAFSVFTTAEVVADIMFICNKGWGNNALLITQAVIIGIFLLSLLIVIGTRTKE